jgi:hypothetical protein
MRIELPTREAADALAEYLRRCDCIVAHAGGCALDAAPCPRSQRAEESQIELEGYLRVWQALHPAIEVRTFGLSPVDSSDSMRRA